MIDGVIKYNFDFQKSKPLPKPLFFKLEIVRKRLYSLGFIGEKDSIGFGNISKRVDKESFVITGTQTGHLSTLEAKHYALIEAYDDKKFYIKSSGASKPSSEALTHGTIYNLCDEIGAVIHIHSVALWNFMLENDFLQTKKVLYGSTEMIREVNRIYNNLNPLSNPKFVMAGHEEGIIIFGKDLQEAEIFLLEIIGVFLSN